MTPWHQDTPDVAQDPPGSDAATNVPVPRGRTMSGRRFLAGPRWWVAGRWVAGCLSAGFPSQTGWILSPENAPLMLAHIAGVFAIHDPGHPLPSPTRPRPHDTTPPHALLPHTTRWRRCANLGSCQPSPREPAQNLPRTGAPAQRYSTSMYGYMLGSSLPPPDFPGQASLAWLRPQVRACGRLVEVDYRTAHLHSTTSR